MAGVDEDRWWRRPGHPWWWKAETEDKGKGQEGKTTQNPKTQKRQRQKDHKFQTSLDRTGRPYFKKDFTSFHLGI